MDGEWNECGQLGLMKKMQECGKGRKYVHLLLILG
jgi:hypothetical protein